MFRLFLLAASLTLFSPAFAQSAADYTEANTKADAQPKSDATSAYADAWAEFNNSHHLDERDGCYFMAEGELTQILEMDASGKVVGYFADKDNGRSQCWRSTYFGVVFPKPPFAPYWHKLVMY